jgi:isopenicillin N synthase-like dioxygenase
LCGVGERPTVSGRYFRVVSSAAPTVPVIDIGALIAAEASEMDRHRVAAELDRACRAIGFFGLSGHGLDPVLFERLDAAAREFFELPETTKAEIAMSLAGPAWRGWFPVEGELTSGRPDRKEGIYFGIENARDHPRVVSPTPLHGANQFPTRPQDLRDAVLDWLDALRPIADAVMQGLAIGLGLPASWFEDGVTADPTILFRIFHYPPTPLESTGDDGWGVGEHTDYGLITLLAQDDRGGLQVKALDGSWLDVDPQPGVLVCNLGDMLERLTAGRYRSTPHRVRNTSGGGRLSFPYFFDPSWDSTVPTLPLDTTEAINERWDGQNVLAWEGTYGDYLTSRVAKVFPDLFRAVSSKAE